MLCKDFNFSNVPKSIISSISICNFQVIDEGISFDILNNSANFTLELIDGNIELSTDVMDDDASNTAPYEPPEGVQAWVCPWHGLDSRPRMPHRDASEWRSIVKIQLWPDIHATVWDRWDPS